MKQTVFVVDDDEAVRDALKMLLHAAGMQVELFASAASFLNHYRLDHPGCVVLDVRMPGTSGLALQEELNHRLISLPVVFLTGHADVPIAVRAMKQGAFDFIEKPIAAQRLVPAIRNALAFDAEQRSRIPQLSAREGSTVELLGLLSEREREVLAFVLDGTPTRGIAEQLRLSIKTVEFHRARIREKLGVTSMAELFRLFLGNNQNGTRS
jgi:FixJ family two-component response regulator